MYTTNKQAFARWDAVATSFNLQVNLRKEADLTAMRAIFGKRMEFVDDVSATEGRYRRVRKKETRGERKAYNQEVRFI